MTSIIRVRRLGACAAVASALFVCAAMEVAAQDPADGAKDYIVNAFERAKAWDLALAEAMPDSAREWAPTADVRGWASQIVHTANNGFIAMPLFGEDAPAFGDEAELVADRAALMSAVTNAYDYLIGKLRAMPAADLSGEVDFFGRTMTRGRVAMFAIEHAMWTRGQLVPYLHAHGVAVPQAMLF
jgi:hypothetical protein